MYRIAIVEDEQSCAENLKGFLLRFSEENGDKFAIDVYLNSVNFIDEYKGNYDIVFMDIEMPMMDGMTVARKLREKDEEVVLVFVTYMAKYAVEGYSVNALDFILKPVTYFNFADKLKRAFKRVVNREVKTIRLSSDDGAVFVPVSQIYYVEKDKNYLVYYTERGVFRQVGVMHTVESNMTKYGFVSSISGVLINMKYITKISNNSVWVNDDCLPISRAKRKEFIATLMQYYTMGGGITNECVCKRYSVFHATPCVRERVVYDFKSA